MLKTGFIGLGAMGLPMARNLHRAGLLAAVWNRTSARAAAIASETGCLHCKDIAELAAHCEAVVTCVSADEDLLAVIRRLTPNLRTDAIVIDCSTVDAATARSAAASVVDAGASFLDCPVSGGTEGARLGTLSIMVGGGEGDLQRARPVLETLGRSVIHMGPVGAGQAAKATNQIMVAGINQAVTEALAFGQAQGLPPGLLLEALSAGAAGSWFLSHRGPTMVEDQYPLGFKVALHQKDLAICSDMAADMGVKLPVVEMTKLHYRRLLERGLGELDISSLFILKKEIFDKEAG